MSISPVEYRRTDRQPASKSPWPIAIMCVAAFAAVGLLFLFIF